ncbi:Pr6Pr family membrane protein (plasmid) [Mycolicibacterium psychrotolerans]|uniref:Pr6Pr family membrane protein n=1 Tax=Mycolicibacterium psychrotolerans TaxID=216929 RepID=UPI003D6765EE
MAPLTAAIRLLPAVILISQAIAIACQFLQRTDPTFPLLYFTVDSALLAAVAAAGTLCRPHDESWLSSLRVASTVGVLLSAIIFAAVIAPATPTGTWIQPHDDDWVRTATILMHGVAPVLVTVDLLLRPAHGRLWRYLGRSVAWPAIYLAVLSTLTAVGRAHIPYPFLTPSRVGWWAVLGAALVLLIAVVAIAAALYAAQRRFGIAVQAESRTLT